MKITLSVPSEWLGMSGSDRDAFVIGLLRQFAAVLTRGEVARKSIRERKSGETVGIMMDAPDSALVEEGVRRENGQPYAVPSFHVGGARRGQPLRATRGPCALVKSGLQGRVQRTESRGSRIVTGCAMKPAAYLAFAAFAALLWGPALFAVAALAVGVFGGGRIR